MPNHLFRNENPFRFQNNFNLLRFIAATFVIISHSFPLIYADNSREPLYSLTHVTFGNLGVFIFFAISGYLVTGSFISTASIWKYAVKRALRIYPALVVAILFCTVLGAFATDLPPAQYFLSHDTLAFAIKNSILVLGLHYHLPGVFIHNPMPYVVNGSLWTLPEELKMYVGVVLAGLAGLFNKRLVLYFLAASFGIAVIVYFPTDETFSIALYFAAGAVFYLSQDIIRYTPVLLAAACLTVVLLIYLQLPGQLLVLPVTYCVFHLSFLENKMLLKFNDYGDYSYGLYIYAFPIQQFLVLHGIRVPYQLFLLSFFLSLVAAFLSWHLIEKRALKYKPV